MTKRKFRKNQWLKPLRHKTDDEDDGKVRWAKGWKPNLLFAVIVIAMVLLILGAIGVI